MGFKSTNIAATTAAVANRLVASANMKVGDYTIANASPVWPATGIAILCLHRFGLGLWPAIAAGAAAWGGLP